MRSFLLGMTVLIAHLPSHSFAQQTQQRVSREDARVLASQLISIGQPSAAREIARGLLRIDPSDVAALVALARAEMTLGNVEAAETAARAAKAAATTKGETFLASLAIAEVLAQSERFTRSQLWVRRAIQTAPNQQAEQLAIQAFQRVRQANPLAIELQFGLSPSSNVNSGNSNEAINFAFLPGTLSELRFLVPPDERPLSGLEISLQTDLRYRIAQTKTSRTSLEFGAYGRTYIMSDSAKTSAPEVTGESLSFMQASFGVLHQWRPDGASAPYSVNLTYRRDWLGGSPYRYELNATLGTQFTFANEDRLSVSGGVRYSKQLSSGTDVLAYSARGRWSRTLDNDDVIGVTAQVSRATSDTTDLAYTDGTLGVNYNFGEISFGETRSGIDVAASYTEQYRAYETSAFDPAGREDRISSLRLDVGLQNVDFYGFQPVVTLQARRTDSSIARFDTQGAQIGFNLRSSF